MQNNIRAKTAQFKDDFRKLQAQHYRRTIRQQLLSERLSQSEQLQLNHRVASIIQQQNLTQIYELLYRGKTKQPNGVPISSLTQQSIINLLVFLMQNIARIESLLLINNVIDLHYSLIFLNKQHLNLNQLLVRTLYDFCRNLVLTEEIEKFNQAKKLVNAALNCIKSLIFNKDQEENGYSFKQVVRIDYIVSFLFAWLQKLIENPLYLIAITILEYDMEISSIEIIRQYLNYNPQVIERLLRQADPQNNIMKSCALPSISLANSFIKKIDNKQALRLIVGPCLEASKIVYGLTQKANQQFYRIHTFLQSINVIAQIFKKLADQILQVPLCQMMVDHSYWVFCNIILRSQTYHVRQIIFKIVLHAVQNAVAGKAKLQNFISQTAVGLFIEGLEQSNQSIMRCSMEIFSHIFCYCNSHFEQTKELIEWIDMFQIDVSLQNLQHLPNKEIAGWATKLLALKAELEQGTAMHDQNA